MALCLRNVVRMFACELRAFRRDPFHNVSALTIHILDVDAKSVGKG